MKGQSHLYGVASKAAKLAAIAAICAATAEAANAPRDPTNGRKTYSGSNMECLVANDFYVVHFTAFQEGQQSNESTPFTKYCQEVPAVGKTFLTIDLLDRDVRNTPIALAVVEEEIHPDGRLPEVKSTLSEVPAKIYRNGIADTHVDITKPGHYALIATIGEDAISEDDRLRVPFSVALPPPTDYSQWIGRFVGGLVFLFFGVMAFIGLRTWRAYRPKAADNALPKGDLPKQMGL